MEQKTAVIIASRPVTAGMQQYVPPGAYIVAADAGWETARRHGWPVDLAVGDFDSSPQPQGCREVMVLPAEKDDTDTHFAAGEVLRRGYSNIVLLGVLGGRRDHEQANYQTMLYLARRGAKVMAADENGLIWCCGAGTHAVEVQNWQWLSVFAAGGIARDVTLRGVKYPLTQATLTPDVPIGVSNEFTEDIAHINCGEGFLYVMVTR